MGNLETYAPLVFIVARYDPLAMDLIVVLFEPTSWLFELTWGVSVLADALIVKFALPVAWFWFVFVELF